MTFKQLLQSNNWSSISSKFLEIYPEAEENLEGYKHVFEKLEIMNPEEIDMSIVITNEEDEEEEYLEISGLYNNPKSEEEHYSQSIEFTPWRQWLGMDISKESLAEFSELEIIVHCLYEMTFVSFSEEEIQNRIAEMEKNTKEREAMTEEEQAEIALSIEELLKTWNDEDDDESTEN